MSEKLARQPRVGRRQDGLLCATSISRAISRKVLLGCGIGLLIIAGGRARSADILTKVPPPTSYSWTGFYLGGHFGYGVGSFGPGANPISDQAEFLPSTLTGFIGGFQGGYNFQLANSVVLGLEADLSFTSPIDRPATGLAPFNTTFDYFGTARGRVGYAFGSLLPYVTAGFAWGQTKVDLNHQSGNVVSSKSTNHVGWTVGAGVEYALKDNWTAKFEYNYIDLGSVLDELAPTFLNIDPKLHIFRLRLELQVRGSTASECVAFSSDCSSGIQRLERSRADHFYRAGLSTFPLSLCWDQQPSWERSGPGDLDGDGVHRLAALAGRRILF